MATITSSTSKDFYVYALFRENGVPFYVGKGNAKRWRWTEWKSSVGGRGYKFAIIRDMQARGDEVIKLKVHEGLTETVAHQYETALIAAIGRYPNGPLANATDGGEGSSGWTPTPDVRANMAAGQRGRKHSPGSIEASAAGRRGKKQKPEHVAAKAARQRGKKQTPEHVENAAATRRGKPWSKARRTSEDGRFGMKRSAETCARISAATKGIKKSPQGCANMSAAKVGKPWSAARRASQERRRAERS